MRSCARSPSAATRTRAGRSSTRAWRPWTPPVAPVAVAVAQASVEQPSTLLALIEQRQDLDQTLRLLRDGFNALNDDFGEEQFFVALRAAYFAEPEGSARRPLIQSVINALEF